MQSGGGGLIEIYAAKYTAGVHETEPSANFCRPINNKPERVGSS